MVGTLTVTGADLPVSAAGGADPDEAPQSTA
jgi:hypothetical protein